MFTVGDRVRAKVMNPHGHTRLPAYLRGRPGSIVAILGTMPFSDARAAGDHTTAQTVYTVRFATEDVWGSDGDARGAVCADLFESYLEAP